MNPFYRHRARFTWFARMLSSMLILIAPAGLWAQSTTKKPTKKLIEFGWDAPDTAFLRRHFGEMEKTPFDGCVVYVRTTPADGKPGEYFFWQGWGERTITAAEVSQAVDDLKATPLKRFTHNFIRFDVSPGNLDWFDDHAAVMSNARLAARIAREGKCAGILFDTEQYHGKLFNYRKQRDANSKSWDEYAAQARLCGREVMRAFQEGYPGLTVFLTYGHCLPWKQAEGRKENLPDADYGLLAPFADGLVDGTDAGTTLVDGYEVSYSYKDPAKFPAAYREASLDQLAIVTADPAKYRNAYSFGFGIWLDYSSDERGWHPEDFSKNHFTPDLLEASVRKALETSDEYVWIYTERLSWWAEESGGKPTKLPAAYIDALWRARQGLAKD